MFKHRKKGGGEEGIKIRDTIRTQRRGEVKGEGVEKEWLYKRGEGLKKRHNLRGVCEGGYFLIFILFSVA